MNTPHTPPAPAPVVTDEITAQLALELDAARDADADAALAEILAELPQTDPDDLPDGPQVAAGVDEPEAPEAPDDAEEPEPTPKETRAMLRLMEREAAIREREAAAEKRESELVARLADMEDRLSRVPDEAQMKRRLLTSPVKFLEALGIPPEQVSRLIIAEKLGDQAPPELRDAAEKAAMRLELEEMREEMARERTRGSVREHSSKLKGESKYPTLARIAEVDPDRVANAIMSRLPRNPGPADYERATKAVEDDWAVFARVFQPAGGAAPAAAKNAPAAPPADPAKTAPAAQPETAAAPATPKKRPVPPRRPWGSNGDWEDQAEAALAEATAVARRARA